MNKQQEKQARLARRHRRVRGKISGTAARPRLCVTRSNSNMYVQVIDDVAHTTICGVSTLGEAFKATGKSGATVEGAGKRRDGSCVRPWRPPVSWAREGSGRSCP